MGLAARRNPPASYRRLAFADPFASVFNAASTDIQGLVLLPLGFEPDGGAHGSAIGFQADKLDCRFVSQEI